MTQHEALDILRTGANVFLTGEPGSGKTHTVNAYIRWLRERGIEPAVTASTGIAATHVHGMTIHSWSGIGVRRTLTKDDLAQIAGNSKVRRRVGKTRVLIIDEISMLDGRTLGMIDAVCRAVRGGMRPFGGIQAVFVGDFFQLPPVTEEGTSAEFAFASSAWRAASPVVCYLTEQHRQDDRKFISVLSAIRSRNVTEAERTLINARVGTHTAAVFGIPKLFTHNVDVDRMNTEELAKLPGAPRTFRMSERGPKPLVEALRRGCLSPEMLVVKQNAVVMFTKNHPAGRFVNGTLGTVSGFDAHSGYPIVKTRDNAVISAEPMEWTIEEGGRTRATVVQVPLRLAWAITVHKSQGMSMDAAVVNLADSFEFGQGYVAFSRVRTFAGLHLMGYNERALEVHPEVLARDREFREASEATQAEFARMSQEQRIETQRSFVRAAGGKPITTVMKKETARAAGEQHRALRDAQGGDAAFARIREGHPNAYRPWREEDDDELRRRFIGQATTTQLAKEFGRDRGAIRSRLKKLGLIKE